MMDIEIVSNLKEYFNLYPESAILDFSGEEIQKGKFKSIVVGCEGGFTKEERKLFLDKSCYNLDTLMILKSESAVVAVSVTGELI